MEETRGVGVIGLERISVAFCKRNQDFSLSLSLSLFAAFSRVPSASPPTLFLPLSVCFSVLPASSLEPVGSRDQVFVTKAYKVEVGGTRSDCDSPGGLSSLFCPPYPLGKSSPGKKRRGGLENGWTWNTETD